MLILRFLRREFRSSYFLVSNSFRNPQRSEVFYYYSYNNRFVTRWSLLSPLKSGEYLYYT